MTCPALAGYLAYGLRFYWLNLETGCLLCMTLGLIRLNGCKTLAIRGLAPELAAYLAYGSILK
jgi:hypothetical protein